MFVVNYVCSENGIESQFHRVNSVRTETVKLAATTENEFLAICNFVCANIDHCEFSDSNNCVSLRYGHTKSGEEEAARSIQRRK